MKKLVLIMLLTFLCAGMAGMAMAQDEAPAATPVPAPALEWWTGLSGNMVILPFYKDGPKVYSGANLELLRGWDTVSLNLIGATDFDSRSFAGATISTDPLKLISKVDPTGAVKWVQETLNPTIGLGFVTPTDDFFHTGQFAINFNLLTYSW